MISAKEMFEKLGYKQNAINGIIEYLKVPDSYVEFYVNQQVYATGNVAINMSLHKAINKQLEEWGWLDE